MRSLLYMLIKPLWNIIIHLFSFLFHTEFFPLVYIFHVVCSVYLWRYSLPLLAMLYPSTCLIPQFLFPFFFCYFVLQLPFFMQSREHRTWRHVLTHSGRNSEQYWRTTVRSSSVAVIWICRSMTQIISVSAFCSSLLFKHFFRWVESHSKEHYIKIKKVFIKNSML